MKPLSTAALLAATFGWLAALFAVQPFERANAVLDRAFRSLPAWSRVENLYYDPYTQEATRGDHPLESFLILKDSWAAHPQAERIVLMGNSQAQTASLAAGEARPSGPEKTYTDLMADCYRRANPQKLFYRLSAVGLSYQEMLWYAAYLASIPEIKPHVLVVQLNYQGFANSGIRAGLLELLSHATFRRAAEEFARANRPDSDAFADALRRYDEALRKALEPGAVGPGTGRGDRLETSFRNALAGIPQFEQREDLKQSFTSTLFRCRSYILRLDSASRRSLAGPRIAASRAALEDLLDLCARSGIRVILFQAPTNPAVPLYKTTEDDRSYHAFVAGAASRFGAPILDFEHCIPARHWGQELNVPDPLHLGREGHRLLAKLMLAGLAENGT